MTVNPNELRQRFLDYFDARMKEHAGGKVEGSLKLPSSSLQPPDKSTLFTSAGMHQFKDDFTGNLVHNTRAATTVQKCMRTPDLENVGKTARHHTFFEMLGFFSFGDGLDGPNGSKGFFKKEAIRWIWDFYTGPDDESLRKGDRGCALNWKMLRISVYGDDNDPDNKDMEAYGIWLKLLSAPEYWGSEEEAKKRITFLGEHDNFWPAGAPSNGPNGVCGPCSEIFYDLEETPNDLGNLAQDDRRFMEIGNIVFTQYERSGPIPGKGTLTPLPSKNIDFGGGFERLVMVLQGVPTTLDTKLFFPVRDKLRELAREELTLPEDYWDDPWQNLYLILSNADELLSPYDPEFFEDPKKRLKSFALNSYPEMTIAVESLLDDVNWYEKTRLAIADAEVREKRIADHVRALCFSMADGIAPSNEGAGYVVRRIIRRAYRDGVALGFEKPFLHKLVPVLIEEYGEDYSEILHRAPAIISTLRQEQTQFSTTLERGLQLLAGHIRALKKKGERVLPGKPAFDLYQSQGLPREVVQDELAAEDLSLDQVGYDEAEAAHREASRGDKQAVVFEKGWFQEVKGKYAPTEFLGYETCDAPAKVVAIARDGELFDIIEAGDSATIVLDRTPFYGESGGQVGDRGSLQHDESTFEVADTQKRDDYFLHEGKLLHGKLRVGDEVTARVDGVRRDRIRSNHSATHLMHAALRTVLGDHVVQRGSEVGPDRLRFDFSHPKALSFDERQQIEKLVNEQIQANTDVGTQVMAPEDAQKAGAMALFGEKYGDKVRVLSMGKPRGADFQSAEAGKMPAAQPFSMELCGGTHVGRTGDIGYFRIINESSSSAGVRRIEAITGADAYNLAGEEARTLAELHGLTKAQPGKIVEKVQALIKEVKDLKSSAKKGGGVDAGKLDAIRKSAETISGVTVYVAELDGVEAPDLLTIKDALGQDGAPSAVLLGSRGEGRALLLLSFTKDLTGRGLHAGKIVGEMARLVGGGGGGKPEIAQAGGKNPEGLSQALTTGLNRIREALEKA